MKSRVTIPIIFFLLFTACAVPGSGESTPVVPQPGGDQGYTLDWLTGLSPDAVLLQMDYEPTFFRMEATYPFGRVPAFTLYADGTLIFLDSGASFDQQQVLSVQLNADQALAIVQEVMGADFESLEDYLDFCMPQDDGSETCIADAAYTILRATLSDGTLKTVKSYANFSNDPAALEEITLLLGNYSNPDAEVYQPAQAALFYRFVAANIEVPVSPWPLDANVLSAGGEDLRAFVLEGKDLTRVIEGFGRNTGDFYVESAGQTFSVYLVPWPTYADFSAELTAAFPTPTPAPVPEPIFELAENAKANLAGLLGITADQIKVTSIEQVDWPDGCLGIDYLDMMCTMAIVPGYRLILEVNGETYEYRSNQNGSLLLLFDPGIPPASDSPDAILILEPGPGSRIVSPLIVKGESDPTFEQTLIVQIILDDGSILALQPVQIQADIGQRGPFSIEIPFDLRGERQAFIQVYATSARDGGIFHLTATGVILAESGVTDIRAVGDTAERIRIDFPAQGAALTSGMVRVEGFALASFEQTLVIEILDENGTVLASQPVLVQAQDWGIPGPFSADIALKVSVAGAGRIVVRDPSPAFNGDVHLASLEVTLLP